MNTSSRSVPKTHRVHPTNWHVGLQIPSHHYEMIVHPNQPHHQQHCLIDLNQSLFLNDQLQLCSTKLHHHPQWLKWPQKHSQNLQAEVQFSMLQYFSSSSLSHEVSSVVWIWCYLGMLPVWQQHPKPCGLHSVLTVPGQSLIIHQSSIHENRFRWHIDINKMPTSWLAAD